jgi:SAM-dependent methyltransferase
MTIWTRIQRLLHVARPPIVDNSPVDPPHPGLEVDEAARLSAMSADELTDWENRHVPSIARSSDGLESAADEKQDPTTALNFPLHWTSAKDSWPFLFDFAVACELLAPRPDDLILDFAAGTCWATEMLVRVGVRTVSVDLSVEMMRRGRARLAADARLEFRGAASFAAARGQALPFRSEVFDAVLCLNALHHLPSYADGLREIHRVLKPGGRAVFSEPGTAHAVQPLSQFRMREEQVIEKAVSLAHVRRLAVRAGFGRMQVVPLRAASAYVLDYSASPADAPPLQRMWDDTLRLCAAEHSRFVLHKGEERPADTWLSAHELVGRLRAHITPSQSEIAVSAGHPFAARVRVSNTGDVVWKAGGRRFGGQVTLGIKLCAPDGTVLREDLGRTRLHQDLAPGEDADVEAVVAGVLGPGLYVMRYDMVVEGVTWFEFQGSPCATTTLCVI